VSRILEGVRMRKSKLGLAMVALILLAVGIGGCAKSATPASTSTAPSAEATKSAGDGSWDAVQGKGELVVGLCAEYPPFESRNAAKTPEGFDVDLANALGKELGVKVKIVDSAWEGLLGGVNKGDYNVLITAMSKEEASAENVNTSNSYYELPEVVMVRTGDTSIKSAADLKGKVVGVQSACSAEKAVDRLTGLKETKRYQRNAEAVLDLRNKRVDAVVVGQAYAVTEGKKQGGVQALNVSVASNSLVIVSKAGTNDLTAKLNGALEQVKADGTYDALVKKWLSIQ
jgi:polar amino acid transport system substrate-binding protein